MFDTDHLARTITEVRGLAGADLGGLDPDTLGQVALAARRLRELADHLEVHALGVLELTGHPDATASMSTAGWFCHQAGLPSAVGRAQTTTARTLRQLPGTDQAWLDGRITRHHVDVLVRAANPRIRHHIATLEDDLVAIAQDRTFLRWHQRVREVAQRLDTEGPDPDDATHTTASWARTGLFAQLRARFGGADVEAVEQILEAHTNRLHRLHLDERTHTPDLPELTRSQLRGLALIDLILHGPNPAVVNDDVDDNTVEHLHNRRAARSTETGPAMRVGISLVIRNNDARIADGSGLPQLNTDVTWSITNPAGQHLAFEHVASLLCDCTLHPLLVDDHDNPLNQGRDQRLASPAQRRAVIVRDGGCTFPGCDCPVAWVEIHHVRWWSNGGPTDIANLAALCRRHHGITHRRGWTMHVSTDGWFWWTTPGGDTFWGQRHGTQRAGPTPARAPTAA